jgi:hypothetical protein
MKQEEEQDQATQKNEARGRARSSDIARILRKAAFWLKTLHF